MGKSLYIKRLREALMTVNCQGPHELMVPIHGPLVTADTVVKALREHTDNAQATIVHLDIAPSVSNSISCKHSPELLLLTQLYKICCLMSNILLISGSVADGLHLVLPADTTWTV